MKSAEITITVEFDCQDPERARQEARKLARHICKTLGAWPKKIKTELKD